MDAFDADVLIYAIIPGHELGMKVHDLFPADAVDGSGDTAGVGSVLLGPEVLTKPVREQANDEVEQLAELLIRLDLRSVDEATATLATGLGATYGLRTIDAIHLATAVGAGADRFITNNRRDFTKAIQEIDVTYPDELGVA